MNLVLYFKIILLNFSIIIKKIFKIIYIYPTFFFILCHLILFLFSIKKINNYKNIYSNTIEYINTNMFEENNFLLSEDQLRLLLKEYKPSVKGIKFNIEDFLASKDFSFPYQINILQRIKKHNKNILQNNIENFDIKMELFVDFLNYKFTKCNTANELPICIGKRRFYFYNDLLINYLKIMKLYFTREINSKIDKDSKLINLGNLFYYNSNNDVNNVNINIFKQLNLIRNNFSLEGIYEERREGICESDKLFVIIDILIGNMDELFYNKHCNNVTNNYLLFILIFLINYIQRIDEIHYSKRKQFNEFKKNIFKMFYCVLLSYLYIVFIELINLLKLYYDKYNSIKIEHLFLLLLLYDLIEILKKIGEIGIITRVKELKFKKKFNIEFFNSILNNNNIIIKEIDIYKPFTAKEWNIFTNDLNKLNNSDDSDFNSFRYDTKNHLSLFELIKDSISISFFPNNYQQISIYLKKNLINSEFYLESIPYEICKIIFMYVSHEHFLNKVISDDINKLRKIYKKYIENMKKSKDDNDEKDNKIIDIPILKKIFDDMYKCSDIEIKKLFENNNFSKQLNGLIEMEGFFLKHMNANFNLCLDKNNMYKNEFIKVKVVNNEIKDKKFRFDELISEKKEHYIKISFYILLIYIISLILNNFKILNINIKRIIIIILHSLIFIRELYNEITDNYKIIFKKDI